MVDESKHTHAAAKSRRRRPWWWRALRVVLIVGLLAAATLGLAWRYRNDVVAPLAIEWLALRIERESGLVLSIDSVDGDWIHGLSLSGVSLLARDERTQIRRISAGRIELAFELRELLEGSLDGLKSVNAADVVARIDFARSGRPAAAASAAPSTFALPGAWPSCSVTGVDLEMRFDAQRKLQLTGAGLNVGPDAQDGAEKKANRAVLNVDRVVVDVWPGSPALVEQLQCALGYRDGVLDVRDLALSGDLDVRATHSQLDLRALDRNELAWHADINAFQGRVNGDGSTRNGNLALSLDITGVELDEVWRVIDPSAHEIPQARVDLRGDVSEDHGEWTGAATVLAHDICLEGRALESVAGELALRPDGLDIERIDVRQSANAVSGTALSIPFNRADLLDTLRSSSGRIALDVHDFTAVTNAHVARVPLHHLHVAGALDPQGVELANGSFATESGELTVRRGRMQWGPTVDTLFTDALFDLDLIADFSDLADFGPIFSTAPWLGSARGSAHLTGTAREPVGEIDVVGRNVTALGFELGDVTLLAHVDLQRARVQALTADGPYGRFEIAGDYDLARQNIERSHCRASTERLAGLWPEIFASGAVELDADLAGPWRNPRGTFTVHARELAATSGPTLDVLDISGSHDANLFRIDSLQARLEHVVLSASGTFDHDDWRMPFMIGLESLALEREGLALALVAPIDFCLENTSIVLHDVQLAGNAGRLVADLDLAGSALDLHLHCEDLAPMPLLAPFAPEGFALAKARGDFELTRAPGVFTLNADFGVDGLRFTTGAPELVLACRGRFDGARATFEELDLRSSDGGFVLLTGDMPLDPFAEQPLTDGPLQVNGSLSLPSIESMPWKTFGLPGGYSGAIAGDLVLNGTWRALRGSFEVTGRRVLAVDEPGRNAATENLLGPIDFDARLLFGEAFELERCSIRAPGQMQCDVVGRYDITGDIVDLAARGASAWREAPIDVHGNVRAEDLTFLAALVNSRARTEARPDPVLRRTGGVLIGQFALTGSLEQPALSGGMLLENGEIRLESALPAFERVSCKLHFEGSRAVLDHLRGDFGAGAFESSGSVDFSGGEAHVDLTLDGRDIALVQQRGLRVRATAELKIAGPLSALHTSGRLALTDGRWTERYDYLSVLNKHSTAGPKQSTWFALRTEPFASMTFDVAIQAKRAFRVDNNLAHAALLPNLHLGGTGAEPQLTGDITLEPSRFMLPTGSLEMLAGSITLTESEARRPELHMQLRTRLRGYDLSIDISGRYDDPTIVITSDPPLSSAEAWQLVLTGQSPASASASASGMGAAQTVAVFLGSDLLASWFGGDEDDAESLMDRIEWQTGSDVTAAGGSTAQVKLRLAGPNQGPGRAVYMRGERDIYDRINFGLRLVLRFR